MRTILVLVMLVCGLALAEGVEPSFVSAWDIDPSRDLSGPAVFVEPVVVDFGKFLPDKPVQQELVVVNKGGAELVIEKAGSSCACVAVRIDEGAKRIAPGGRSTLAVEIDPAKVAGFRSFNYKVSILSNDPLYGALLVDVTGQVDPNLGKTDFKAAAAPQRRVPRKGAALVAEPGVFDMGVISRDGPTRMQVELVNEGFEEVVIDQVSTSCSCVSVSIDDSQKRIARGGRAIAFVSADPAHIGTFDFDRRAMFHYNNPARHILIVPVVGSVDPEYVLDPAVLDFGTLGKGGPGVLDVVLRKMTSEPFELHSVHSLVYDKDTLKVSFEKRPVESWASRAHEEYSVRLELNPDALAPGPLVSNELQIGISADLTRIPEYRLGVEGIIETFYRMYPRRPLTVNVADTGYQPPKATSTALFVGDGPLEVVEAVCESGRLVGTPRAGDLANSVMVDVGLAPGVTAIEGLDHIYVVLKSGQQIARQRIQVNVVNESSDPNEAYRGYSPGTGMRP